MTDVPIGRAFAVLADRDPHAVAVRHGDDVWSRRRLEEDTNRLARSWRGRVGHDDVVTVALPNGVDVLRACVAAWKLGATPQPLSPTLEVAERDAVLALTGPALVVDRPLGEVGGDHRPLPDAVASSWKAPTSSGSTGRPKVVRAAAPATVDLDRPVAPFVPRHAVQLVGAPLVGAATFVYATRGLMTGHELVLASASDPADWLRLVERHRVTWSVLSPAAMHRIHRLGPDALAAADVGSLEQVLHLGARCPGWLKRAWIDWLGPERVVEVYAGTESQGVATITGQEWLERPGSVGRGCGGTRFRVVRPDGRECAPGERGEILMRRDWPTYSYLGAEPDVRDGWHTLGDVGRLDADGYLYVEDRLADVVTCAGTVVYPAEVEGVVEEHPDVRGCVVVPARHAGLGQVVHAVVETDADLADLDRWAAARLTPVQRPRSWHRTAERLRSDTGKVRRSRWRTTAPDGHEQVFPPR